MGRDGHDALVESHVAVLGCGALGTVTAEILARAGVSRIRLVDRDVVEWTNLQRQALYDEADAREGRSKAAAAAEHLGRINSTLALEPIVADVSSRNIHDVLRDVDLVIDAADNFSLRFLLNDWSLETETPWVHGGCVGAAGQVLLFSGLGVPCFRCVVPEPPPAAAVDTCDTAGVVGSATHLIASFQATEAIKWLSGNRQSVRKTLLSIDLWNNRIREIELTPELSARCRACDEGEFEFLRGRHASVSESAAVLCGRDAVQLNAPDGQAVDLASIGRQWSDIGRTQTTPYFVRLFPDPTHTLTMFRDGRVVVTGTDQIAVARGLYDRFVGG